MRRNRVWGGVLAVAATLVAGSAWADLAPPPPPAPSSGAEVIYWLIAGIIALGLVLLVLRFVRRPKPETTVVVRTPSEGSGEGPDPA